MAPKAAVPRFLLPMRRRHESSVRTMRPQRSALGLFQGNGILAPWSSHCCPFLGCALLNWLLANLLRAPRRRVRGCSSPSVKLKLCEASATAELRCVAAKRLMSRAAGPVLHSFYQARFHAFEVVVALSSPSLRRPDATKPSQGPLEAMRPIASMGN